MAYLLGIDLGTSGCKAAVIDLDGQVLGIGRCEYAIDTPQPGWAEQDPRIWLSAAAGTVRQALAQAAVSPAAIAGIGLSGQMHTTVCLDAAGAVLRPAIVWADQRSRDQVAEVYQRVGKPQLASFTQNPLATGFTLANLLWLQEHEPEVYARTRQVLLPKDYLRYHLTGILGTEATDACGTLLMDVAARRWQLHWLDMCGIDPGILPAIGESSQVAGTLTAAAAADFGLPAGIPVVHGSGDQAAQAVGNGIISPGLLSCTIGTGGQLLAPSASAAFDPELRLHTFCHAVPGVWFILAATLSAGLSLNWLRHKVLAGEPYAALADAAATVAPGADGLYFMPYLAGERTPHMDATARGGFIGLTLRHEQAHLTRAVMEGVVFSLRQGLQLITELGVPVQRVVASGGGTRHPLWLQLQADILGRPIEQTLTTEAAATGAALLAGVGAGVYPDVAAACARAVRRSPEVVQPDPTRVARYTQIYQRYAELYPALRPHFTATAETARLRSRASCRILKTCWLLICSACRPFGRSCARRSTCFSNARLSNARCWTSAAVTATMPVSSSPRVSMLASISAGPSSPKAKRTAHTVTARSPMARACPIATAPSARSSATA